MKAIVNISLISIFLISITAFSIIKNIDFKVDESSTLTIEGTSNIHDWVANVEDIKGEAKFSFSDDGMINIDACKIKIDVKSIKSTKGNTMDKKIYKALKAESNPSISFSMNSLNSITKNSNGFEANVSGKLTVAGTTKTISIDILGKELTTGGYEITGKKDLKMTSFNVEPPTALFGTLTTGDDITIEFKTLLN